MNLTAFGEIELEECEGCGVFDAELNGDLLCVPCQAGGTAGPPPFWTVPTTFVGMCEVEEQNGETCGQKCETCLGACAADHPVLWDGPIGRGYCSMDCLEKRV